MKKLTGAGNLFHSALDKAAGMLKRKVGTGAEFMQELNSIPGVKKEEIQDRKLHEIMGLPKMTHEQFLGELGKRPAPQIEEKVLGQKLTPQELAREANQFIRTRARQYAGENADTSREYRILAGDEMRRLRGEHLPSIREHVEREVATQDAPHHEQYTLPGGENYREMLIKAPPGEEQFSGVIAHFGGEPGILASMRLKDRTGPNGEKLLHLEELQSDWHKEGRKKGYHDPEDTVFMVLDANGNEKYTISDENWAKESALKNPGWTYKEVPSVRNGVPDAPFKKNWEEMALKRLIHHAAENGYHGIVVTNGAEQADRYSLAKEVDGLQYEPSTNTLSASKDGRIVLAKTVGPNELPDVIGKEATEKLLATKPEFGRKNNRHELTGVDLQFGGEGMKGFYDKKVPNILNGIGKKYGVKTELGGHPLNIHADLEGHMPRESMEIKHLHHFPITEEMRQDVLKNGLPLYAEGGEVDAEEMFMAKGGKIKELEKYLRDREGEYGLKRLQRAADEIPGLENMYTEEALRRAFGGDNAQALMTMNPADFEKFAIRLYSDPDTREEEMNEPLEYVPGLPPMTHHEYIKYLAKIKGGFADVPFLEIHKKPEFLPHITGHEGRHRSRALAQKGAQTALVRMFPHPSLRESMPRRYREDFIEAMKKQLGEKRLVTGEGRSLLPADLEAPEHKNIERRNMLGGRPQLPEIYKDGGDVDAESAFFPKSKE